MRIDIVVTEFLLAGKPIPEEMIDKQQPEQEPVVNWEERAGLAKEAYHNALNESAKLVRSLDEVRSEICKLELQVEGLRRHRDAAIESIAKFRKLAHEWQSRAETAEKKLAEWSTRVTESSPQKLDELRKDLAALMQQNKNQQAEIFRLRQG